jgi:hypothetical protein
VDGLMDYLLSWSGAAAPSWPQLAFTPLLTRQPAAAVAVLRALAPSLLKLSFSGHGPGHMGHRERLLRLTAALPNMRLSCLTARPAFISNGVTTDVAEHFVITTPPFDSLALLRSEDPSPQPLSTASLTRLNLVHRGTSVPQQPLLFPAAFTAQLHELHLYYLFMACVVPVAALPPHLTALHCLDTPLQLHTATTEQLGTAPRPEDAASTSAGAVGSTAQSGVWEGLQQLHTLELAWSEPRRLCVGGGLPDLLRHMPNLKHLVCPADLRPASVTDASRLRGCAQGLTHLRLCGGFCSAEDADAEVAQVCEWVGSLRHLRHLHLDRDDIPAPLFAQVSCKSPQQWSSLRHGTPFLYMTTARRGADSCNSESEPPGRSLC